MIKEISATCYSGVGFVLLSTRRWIDPL